ncbi:MAG: TonB-dependent receptor, partial [Gammaproteobacteria bacterium AqS3]|nr:TonB-dependent receptor [Gammaproteobacteria bacterium AqS3]
GGGEPVIRGSAPRDNAYYIDMIPAAYLFHLFGNSIFDKFLIHSFELYPAAFSSEYGNATGGVIDVQLREPKNQEFTTTLHTSILSAGLLLESGMADDQAFYLSYRRSMMDLFISEDDDGDIGEEGIKIDRFPISEDYQFKYVFDRDDANRLTAVAAGASDFAGVTFGEGFHEVAKDPDFAGPAQLDRRFDSQGIQWDWRGEERKFTSILSSIQEKGHFFFGAAQHENTDSSRLISRNRYQLDLGEGHELILGASLERSSYDLDFNAKFVACNDLDPECSTVDAEYIAYRGTISIDSRELFIEDQRDINERHFLRMGLYHSSDDYTRDARLEPRIRWEYAISDELTTFASVGRYSQLPELREAMELLGNPELDKIKADHYVWGVRRDFGRGWSWQTELYLKDMTDIVISSEQDESAENYSNNAEGRSYGAELLIRKEFPEGWHGWAALSLSQSERTNTVTGETLEFEYDKPILFSLVMNRRIGERWMIGFKWNYQSGAKYTPVVDLVRSASEPDIMEPVYGTLNSYRYPAYHRLDFRAEYSTPKTWGYRKFYVDLLNVYNRENVEEYEYAPGADNLTSPPPGFGANVPVQEETGEGLFPSLGFEVRF